MHGNRARRSNNIGEIRYVHTEHICVNPKKLRKLSRAKILHYVGCYERGDNFPPITVEDCGEFYTVRDGRHRLQAQLACGYACVEVSIY